MGLRSGPTTSRGALNPEDRPVLLRQLCRPNIPAAKDVLREARGQTRAARLVENLILETDHTRVGDRQRGADAYLIVIARRS